MSTDAKQSSNFQFLASHDAIFLQLAAMAELVFSSDQNTMLIKLRQLGEAFTRDMVTRYGLEVDSQTKQIDLLYQLDRRIKLESEFRAVSHTLLIESNKATHEFQTQHKKAQSRVNHLTQSILAKVFRGELTADWRVQHPELITRENSAEALLTRIKSVQTKSRK